MQKPVNPDYRIIRCPSGCLTVERVEPDGEPICEVCKSCGYHRSLKIETVKAAK